MLGNRVNYTRARLNQQQQANPPVKFSRTIQIVFLAAGIISSAILLSTLSLGNDLTHNEMIHTLENELRKQIEKNNELEDRVASLQLQLKSTSMDDVSGKPSSVGGGGASLSWYEKPEPILTEFPPITRRLEFLHHLEKVPSFQTGVEVGVQRGILAKKSLDIWKSCKEYKLIDLWGKEEGYNEPGMDTAADKDANLRQARGRMKKWVEGGVVEFFVMRSTDASKHLPDNHFDYIYLDARHDYCAVKEDISHYWPKLRPGGILGGHDYIDSQYAIDKLGPAEDWSTCEDGSHHPEAVKGAVDEFRRQSGDLALYTSNEDFPSWYIQKPY